MVEGAMRDCDAGSWSYTHSRGNQSCSAGWFEHACHCAGAEGDLL